MNLSFFDKLKFGKAFFGIIENPQATENIFKLASLGLKNPNSPALTVLVNHCFQNQKFKEQYQQKYLPENRSLDSFTHYAPGTLGHAYYQHMKSNNLRPDFFPQENVNLPSGYIVMRLRYAHDIWHVLTGYDTSVEGEICLQAFNLAQAKAGIPAILMATGFLYTLRNRPDDLFDYFEHTFHAFQRGKKARSLLDIKYEELWDRSLPELQKEFGLEPHLLPKA